jgi:NAD(P)-dependent dehydrogenase (short-subunit alcohol dehydrogenase family)
MTATQASMQGKTVVITGASSGIGLETARGLAKLGARIVGVVRSRERGETAIAEIRSTVPGAQMELVLADLYSLAEVRKAAAELLTRYPRIDVLVNNAGLIHDKRELTVDGFERTFALNHLAAFLLTYELRDRLIASAPARLVTVSSQGHRYALFRWNDLATMNMWPTATAVYGASKLCNIWFAREASKRFAGKGVTSNALHPGAVASNFGASGSLIFRAGVKLAKPFLLTQEEGARMSIEAASSPAFDGVTGAYLMRGKVATPSRRARDDAQARKLWDLSETLTNVSWR